MDLEQLGALMTSKIIVDTRNSVSIDLANKAGFKYVGLGRVS
jgi:RimJ/RimL family protein N-acetyltransferase